MDKKIAIQREDRPDSGNVFCVRHPATGDNVCLRLTLASLCLALVCFPFLASGLALVSFVVLLPPFFPFLCCFFLQALAFSGSAVEELT